MLIVLTMEAGDLVGVNSDWEAEQNDEKARRCKYDVQHVNFPCMVAIRGPLLHQPAHTRQGAAALEVCKCNFAPASAGLFISGAVPRAPQAHWP
jgi:hypothetical protein